MALPQIPTNELIFSYSRSSGPGGQNVNKVASKVTLHWDFSISQVLSQFQKEKIRQDTNLASRINKLGQIVLQEQGTRDQHLNRDLVIAKLQAMLNYALTPKKKRIPTKIPRGKKEARLKAKAQHSVRKSLRRKYKESD